MRFWIMLSLGAIAIAGAAAWRPAPPTLTLTATGTGPVRLTWAFTGKAPSGFVLTRSTSVEGLTDAARRYPATRWTLPGHRHGAWQDPAPADGVTYHYRLVATTDAGEVASGAIAVAIPARPLPALTAPTIRVDKRAYVLTVYDRGRAVKRYPIALGQDPVRRKLHFDNASTPEGVYRIANVQPRATYHRAYDLSYPNAIDRERYQLARAGHADFPPIGGEIQIHGRGIHANWTHGCIALRDADMDELFGQPALRIGTEVRVWGGELTEREVEEMAATARGR